MKGLPQGRCLPLGRCLTQLQPSAFCESNPTCVKGHSYKQHIALNSSNMFSSCVDYDIHIGAGGKALGQKHMMSLHQEYEQACILQEYTIIGHSVHGDILLPLPNTFCQLICVVYFLQRMWKMNCLKT